jgi:outer membrane protein TolC
VRNEQFALQQARAQVLAAQDAVKYNQQNLDATQKKFNLGAATVTDVITAQRDLTQASSNLVAALTAYQKAKVELNRLTGRTLVNNRVSIIDAENGHVTQMPQAR